MVQCLVPPGDINQLTINAGYKSTQLISILLTVPRALSRIHCTTKLTLKMAAEQKEKQNLMPPRLHTAMVSQWQLQPEAHFHYLNLQTRPTQKTTEMRLRVVPGLFNHLRAAVVSAIPLQREFWYLFWFTWLIFKSVPAIS